MEPQRRRDGDDRYFREIKNKKRSFLWNRVFGQWEKNAFFVLKIKIRDEIIPGIYCAVIMPFC